VKPTRTSFVRFPSASSTRWKPLPYRRVLSEPEAGALQRDRRKRRSIGDGYWFPLSETPVAGLLAVFADAFFRGSANEPTTGWRTHEWG
jgi:hypothetical protein